MKVLKERAIHPTSKEGGLSCSRVVNLRDRIRKFLGENGDSIVLDIYFGLNQKESTRKLGSALRQMRDVEKKGVVHKLEKNNIQMSPKYTIWGLVG